jgi:hypothetical protein
MLRMGPALSPASGGEGILTGLEPPAPEGIVLLLLLVEIVFGSASSTGDLLDLQVLGRRAILSAKEAVSRPGSVPTRSATPRRACG